MKNRCMLFLLFLTFLVCSGTADALPAYEETEDEVLFLETESLDVHMIEFGEIDLTDYKPGPDGTLRGVYYSNGGGMENSSERINAELLEDGSVFLEFSESHGSSEKQRCYLADEQLLWMIDRIAADHGLRQDVDRPDPEWFALDAPEQTLTLYYKGDEEGEFYSISSTQVWTEAEVEGYGQILQLLNDYSSGADVLSKGEAAKIRKSLE